MVNLETGTSSWLVTLPIKEGGYILHKQSFWDLLSIRYGRRLTRIPSHYWCGNTFNLQHARSLVSKRRFVTLRYNYIRNTRANLLTEVYKEIRVEPQLQPLSGAPTWVVVLSWVGNTLEYLAMRSWVALFRVGYSK